ncbi:MAG: hypothetical protein HOH82_12405 [Planctomycetaceae bacterium]|jgi:hypothetical protein|nr:hypothetical protein [Planctomycetaceae bacterium]
MTKTDTFIKLIFFHRDHIIGGTPPPGTPPDAKTEWKPRPVIDTEANKVINSFHASVREVEELDLSEDLMPLLRSVKEHYDAMFKEARENASLGVLKGAFSLDATHRLNPALNALLNEMPRLRVKYEKGNNKEDTKGAVAVSARRQGGQPDPHKGTKDKIIRKVYKENKIELTDRRGLTRWKKLAELVNKEPKITALNLAKNRKVTAESCRNLLGRKSDR